MLILISIKDNQITSIINQNVLHSKSPIKFILVFNITNHRSGKLSQLLLQQITVQMCVQISVQMYAQIFVQI